MSEPVEPGRAPAPAVVPPAPPTTRMPPWPVALGAGLYVMAFWLLYVLSPPAGKEPSELFKTLAEAIVLTAFVNLVVASVFTVNRDGRSMPPKADGQ